MRVHDYLDYHAREHPDVDFAVQGERRLTYREAAAEANRVANAFVSAGLRAGDRVAILSKNSVEYAIVYYGAFKAGVVLVPLNYRLAPTEWAYIINDAQAKMLIAAGQYVDAADAIRGELQSVEGLVAINAAAPAGWADYRRWTADRPATTPDRLITEDHDIYQMYTSGTTGHPKGAVLTHRAVDANIAQATVTWEGKRGDRFLLVAPVYHAAAAISVFAYVSWGCCLCIQEDFNPAEVVRALSEENIGWVTLVPAMIQACLVAVPDVAERRYDNLRRITYGASPIAEQTLRRAIEVFDCEFTQGYGMTEMTAVLSYLLPADHQQGLTEKPELLLSAGRPLVGTQARVVDKDDNPVPNGVF
jgi:acyl-CoA synthetase (AMP-forming)/AMP-acid ligase II